MKIRDLFKGFEPCSNHNCIITKPVGQATNGSCRCLSNLRSGQMSILDGRIKTLIEHEIVKPNETEGGLRWS
jgi:hypothetical protein